MPPATKRGYKIDSIHTLVHSGLSFIDLWESRCLVVTEWHNLKNQPQLNELSIPHDETH